MEIVIKLSDRALEFIKENGIKDIYGIEEAICNGVVLPKGHGRIVDIDNAVKDLESVNESFCTFYAKGCGAAVDYIGEVLIEADKEDAKDADSN